MRSRGRAISLDHPFISVVNLRPERGEASSVPFLRPARLGIWRLLHWVNQQREMLSQKDPLPFVGPGAEISVSDSGLNWDGRRLSIPIFLSLRSIKGIINSAGLGPILSIPPPG